jgi:uncharacterized membrane protein
LQAGLTVGAEAAARKARFRVPALVGWQIATLIFAAGFFYLLLRSVR